MLRWRIAFDFDVANDHYAGKVGDAIRQVLHGFAVEDVEMICDCPVEDAEWTGDLPIGAREER